MAVAHAEVRKAIPFDVNHLDRLLDEAGIDVLVVTSKHNVQYLLGDYKFFFFEAMDAIGVNRYLPAVVYQRGRPERSAYVGNSMEAYEKELGKFWPQSLYLSTWSGPDTMQRVVEHIAKLGPGVRRVGIEAAFLPVDAEKELRRGLSNVDVVDAFFPLERLRAVKSPKEIEYLQLASERVVESMNVVFGQCVPGKTKQELADALRLEEVKRGLAFDYCLIAAGTSLNRAPSEQKLKPGDVVSIDSGGNYHGYIGDLARMGVVGNKPDGELEDLLAFVEDVQMQSRKPIRQGAAGGSICAVGDKLIAASPHKTYTHFMAHGMGLVSHEAPRLMNNGPVPYPGYDIDRPLEAGMVLSIETTMNHPKRGLIKLEDTVLVTDKGWQGLGDGVRGWQPTPSA
jgi:Xaa-Pro aminopeptidase